MATHTIERALVVINGTLYEIQPEQWGGDSCELRDKPDRCSDCIIKLKCRDLYAMSPFSDNHRRYLKEVKGE